MNLNENTYQAKEESQQSKFQLVHDTFDRSHALCRTDCVSHYHEIPLNKTSLSQSKLYSTKGFVYLRSFGLTWNNSEPSVGGHKLVRRTLI